jgi:DNA mismatch endonuclease (patch repair protein)
MRSPKTDPATSARMRLVRTRGTTPEKAFRSVLRASGTRYRSNWRQLPGTPDFVLPEHRTAVFVHGCFWHACSKCKSVPKRNRAFWKAKLEANRRRDARKLRALQRAGWRTLVLWEHDSEKRMNERLMSFLGSRSRRRVGRRLG